MLIRLTYLIFLLSFSFNLYADSLNSFQWNSLNRMPGGSDSVVYIPLDEWTSSEGNNLKMPFSITGQKIRINSKIFPAGRQ